MIQPLTQAPALTLDEAAAVLAEALRPNVSRPVDVMGRSKPQGRAWSNGKSVWFVLYRRCNHYVGGCVRNEWTPVTRVLPATAKRKTTISKWKQRQLAAQQPAGVAVEGAMAI